MRNVGVRQPQVLRAVSRFPDTPATGPTPCQSSRPEPPFRTQRSACRRGRTRARRPRPRRAFRRRCDRRPGRCGAGPGSPEPEAREQSRAAHRPRFARARSPQPRATHRRPPAVREAWAGLARTAHEKIREQSRRSGKPLQGRLRVTLASAGPFIRHRIGPGNCAAGMVGASLTLVYNEAAFAGGNTGVPRAAPHNYVTRTTRPADFDDFWQSVVEQERKIPLKPEVVPDRLRSTVDVAVYQVFYDSLDNVRVAAWYCVPKKRTSSLPGLLYSPGYLSDPPIQKEWARRGYAVLTVAPRGKVRSRAQFDPGYPGLLTQNITDRNTYSYRGFYVDAWRGVDFLRSTSRGGQQPDRGDRQQPGRRPDDHGRSDAARD